MKSTKRLLCLLLCAAMALSLLTACGGQGEATQSTASTAEATTAPTTIPETTVPETEPKETNLTVGEFEERLNTMLKAADIPLEYDFYEWYQHGVIYSNVTYTGSDNPFIENLYGYEYDATSYYFSFGNMLVAYSDDADQSAITEFIFSTDYRDEAEPQVALFRQLIPIIISACDAQITDKELDMFMSMEFVKGESSNDVEYYEKVFQNDVIRCQVSEWIDSSHVSDGTNEWYEDSLRIDIEFLNVSSDDRNIPSGKELLDPKYLDFEFDIHQPMVTDIMFNINSIDYTTQYSGGTGEFLLDEVLEDYLGGTKTPLLLDDYWFTKTAEYYGFSEFRSGWVLDPSVFYITWNWDDTEVGMHYSTSEEYFQDGEPEYIIRAAIGLGMLLDEGMTAEEAVQLHTHAMESTTTEEGWQITDYCPRDVMHIVEVNPATGENIYYLMTREYFEITYGSVEEFLLSIS